MTVPDFSSFAGDYARARPRYPPSLFAELASAAARREVAWDCATGNGQAALGLVDHFQQVIATDHSREQILQAAAHPRIEYRVAPAERSGLEGGSVDLITVAAALHWFDLDAFFAEARRVLRPGGVLAAWTYHVGHVEPPFDAVFERFYRDVLKPYFAEGARLADELYETLPLPGESLAIGAHFTTADWNLQQMLAFIASWSGTRSYIEKNGTDPVAVISDELHQVWGRPDSVHTVRWPLFIRACRP